MRPIRRIGGTGGINFFLKDCGGLFNMYEK